MKKESSSKKKKYMMLLRVDIQEYNQMLVTKVIENTKYKKMTRRNAKNERTTLTYQRSWRRKSQQKLLWSHLYVQIEKRHEAKI